MNIEDEFSAQQARHLMQCWSAQKDYSPIPVERTEGCWIHTTDGRNIFDLRSAHECINLGFNHPRILEAMRRQMESAIYVTDDFATAATAQLASRLAKATPGSPDKKVFFSQSGAAAVETAIKAARMFKYNETFRSGASASQMDAPNQYPYPYKIISRYRSWHGSTGGAASASGDPRRWFTEPMTMPGVVFAPDADAYRPRFKGATPEDAVDANLGYLDYMIEQEGGNNKVAALLVEPVVGSNGIIPPPPNYLPRLAELCKKWNLLLIADETMTGMGRTGKFLAIDHWGIEPDIIVMGKALGAYCPLAATIFSERLSRSFDDNIFGHGQSFSGHALACAAALASIDIVLEDGFLERVQTLGADLGRRLQELSLRHPSVGDVRGLGLFWTIELVRDKKTQEPLRKATEKYSTTIVKTVSEFLFKERNIYVPADKFGLWIVPPLIVTNEEIDFLIEGIEAALTLADSLVLDSAVGTDSRATTPPKGQ